MYGLTHNDALQKFKQVKKGVLTLTVRTGLSLPDFKSSSQMVRSKSSSTMREHSPLHSENSSSLFSSNPNDRVIIEVSLQKESGVGLGVGLCSVPNCGGISGVFIHTLSPGSVAHMDGRLRKGDELVEINEHTVTNKPLNEVYALLSHCNPGAVIILISRHPDPQISEQQLQQAMTEAMEKEYPHWNLEGDRKMASCCHGKYQCESCIEKHAAYLYYSRREQRQMVRSSSDSNYNPRSMNLNQDSCQMYGLKSRVHSVDVPVRTDPIQTQYSAPVKLGDCSPPANDALKSTQVLCKKTTGHSGEIIVKKLTSKPAPPPRKYYKQDPKDDEAGNLILKGNQQLTAHSVLDTSLSSTDSSHTTTADQTPPDSGSSAVSHHKPLLRRQARVDYSFDPTAEDPWVRISDCIKNLFSPIITEDQSIIDMDGNISTGDDSSSSIQTDQGQQATYSEESSSQNGRSEDITNLKKGPPVAPKPTWFRQSLKGTRTVNRSLDNSAFDKPKEYSNISRSSCSNRALSIKQKISSFETFSSPQPVTKGSNRPSSQSPVQHEKPFHREVEVECVTVSFNKVSVNTVESKVEKVPEPQIVPPEPVDNTEARVSCSPPRIIILNARRSSSTSNESQLYSSYTEFTEPLPYKTPSQRSRSYPLSSTPSADTTKKSENCSKLYSISSQVSSALMKSLLAFPQSPLPQSKDLWQTEATATEENPWNSFNENHPLDTGFSVNLSGLKGYGTGQQEKEKEDTISEQPIFLPSSAASNSQSVISLLPAQELNHLIEEVKALDEETLKEFDEIHVVVLHKEEGAGLGFSLAGGLDLENKAITVHRVFPNGLTSQEGTMQKGDKVLSINGKSLKAVTHNEALGILREARLPRQAVIVIKKEKDGEQSSSSSDCVGADEQMSGNSEEAGFIMTVTLEKSMAGLGFSLDGGKGSVYGNKPIVINRIFKGVSDKNDAVQPGDELLQLGNISLQGLTRFEAWTAIKTLPNGPVQAVIRRSCIAGSVVP
ncbi:pro-interleukin-16 [Pyxicephalus adspersus]|uniref:pro-interleukin-16 n=1 Tax=Pyxicephalus adspersus TaxID=30357 RepID=UPI003B5CC5EF